mmetsp:Transcript_122595/g.291496  ORF Transcript_122595/g.291496 Transcript_122595/m.291496 type:complete len:328 (+) Transcript_122595:41-1024(+)
MPGLSAGQRAGAMPIGGSPSDSFGHALRREALPTAPQLKKDLHRRALLYLHLTAAVQCRQSILQPLDLLLPPLLALLVGLRFGHALVLQLCHVVLESVKLFFGRRVVGAQLVQHLLQRRQIGGVRIHIVLFGRLHHGVVFGDPLVLRGCLLLLRLQGGDALVDVGLDILEHGHHLLAPACRIPDLGVEGAQHLQRQAEALHAILGVTLGRVEEALLLLAHLIHFRLRLRQISQLLPEGGGLLCEVRDLRPGLFQLGPELLHILLAVCTLDAGGGHFFVAEGLVIRLCSRLRLHAGNHALNESSHLPQGIIAPQSMGGREVESASQLD